MGIRIVIPLYDCHIILIAKKNYYLLSIVICCQLLLLRCNCYDMGSNKQGLSPYGSPHHSLSRLSGQGAYTLINCSIYGLCGSRISRQFGHRVTVFTANSDRQCWSQFSIEVYGRETVFSAPFCKYYSNLQTVSEKMFSLGP